MAITVTNRAAAYDNVDRTSYTTASVTVAAGSVILVGAMCSHATADAPAITVSGHSLSWTESAMTLYSGTTPTAVRRIAVWEAYSAAGSSGTITIDHSGATSTGTAWSVNEVTGMDTADPVLQPTTNTGGASPFSVTLSAASDSNNRGFMFSSHRSNGATAPEAGGNWLELSDNNGNSPSTGAQAQWTGTSFDTTCTATGGATNWGAVALEIKIAAAGPATPVIEFMTPQVA